MDNWPSLKSHPQKCQRRCDSVSAWLLHGPLAALQFLTIIPPLVRRPFTPTEMGVAVGFFPAVGLLLGGLLSGLHWGLRQVLAPGLVAALITAAWIALTGALHLDGFLDTCDGLFGGHTPEERLRIMRDERVGAFALAGGVLLLILKYSTLTELAAIDANGPLILAPVLARWTIATAIVAFPYGRPDGLGRVLKQHAGWPQAVLATAIALASSWLLAGWRGLMVWALIAAVAMLIVRWTMHRLPGLTGDVYGALCEIAEVLALLLFALILQEGKRSTGCVCS